MGKNESILQSFGMIFYTPEDAMAKGYRPCKICKPPTSSITTPTPTPSPTPTVTSTPTPGFEAVFAIAGLLAVVYLLRRK